MDGAEYVTVGGTRETAEMRSPPRYWCWTGFSKVEESSQSNSVAGIPDKAPASALREVKRNGISVSSKDRAIRVEVLPVPPVKRIAIIEGQ